MCMDAERINEGYITKSIHKTELLKGIKEPEKLVDKWLVDMALIGLIRIEHIPNIGQTVIYLTEKGLEEYKNQTYHILAANLLEAQESRRLSRVAILVAMTAIVVAIAVGIISCMLK